MPSKSCTFRSEVEIFLAEEAATRATICPSVSSGTPANVGFALSESRTAASALELGVRFIDPSWWGPGETAAGRDRPARKQGFPT
jgi:hypothetical protein